MPAQTVETVSSSFTTVACIALVQRGLVVDAQASSLLMLHNAGGKGADFLVVDINYFPGFEKLPNHAALMVDFLQSLLSPVKGQKRHLSRHLSTCLDEQASDSE